MKKQWVEYVNEADCCLVCVECPHSGAVLPNCLRVLFLESLCECCKGGNKVLQTARWSTHPWAHTDTGCEKSVIDPRCKRSISNFISFSGDCCWGTCFLESFSCKTQSVVSEAEDWEGIVSTC